MKYLQISFIKIISSFIILIATFDLYCATPIPQTNFVSPVKYKIVLAGSFGELRRRHFHAGLDIKSNRGGEGDSIFSAEEGFVSRIKIQRGGYGRAIYIQHPNGYTTVYAHLKGFTEEIKNYVESIQQSNQSYEIDICPTANLLSLQRRQHFAYLGNSGRSSGPHLHFEIRETLSDNPMNPLLFGIKPFDDIAPTITGVRVTGLDNDFQKTIQKRLATKKEKSGAYAPLTFEVDGDIAGISFSGYDQNNGSSNHNGIYKMEMYVDDALHYGYNINSFAFRETNLIECHTDYEILQKENRTEVLCYRLPANKLSIIDYENNNGLIPVDEFNFKNIKIVLSDFEGNTTTQFIQVKKKTGSIISNTAINENTVYHGVKHTIKKQSISITFYEESLPKNSTINVYENAYNQASEYSIGSPSIPILKNIRLAAYIPEHLRIYNDKLGLMLLGREPDSFGQMIEGDSIITYVDDFGRYGFFVDTIAPKITPSSFSKSTSANTFKFKLSDNVQTRYQATPFTYNVWIDGVWKPCEYKDGSEVLTVPLEGLYAGDHSIRITTRDQFGNEGEWASEFVFLN